MTRDKEGKQMTQEHGRHKRGPQGRAGWHVLNECHVIRPESLSFTASLLDTTALWVLSCSVNKHLKDLSQTRKWWRYHTAQSTGMIIRHTNVVVAPALHLDHLNVLKQLLRTGSRENDDAKWEDGNTGGSSSRSVWTKMIQRADSGVLELEDDTRRAKGPEHDAHHLTPTVRYHSGGIPYMFPAPFPPTVMQVQRAPSSQLHSFTQTRCSRLLSAIFTSAFSAKQK